MEPITRVYPHIRWEGLQEPRKPQSAFQTAEPDPRIVIIQVLYCLVNSVC